MCSVFSEIFTQLAIDVIFNIIMSSLQPSYREHCHALPHSHTKLQFPRFAVEMHSFFFSFGVTYSRLVDYTATFKLDGGEGH